MMNIRTCTAAFLGRQLRGEQYLQDDGNVDLFAAGLVNSLFALQLVQFVEREFGITVTGDDLSVDNFRSLNAIDEFVARKVASVGEPVHPAASPARGE
ncbi:MAG: acyl carrier protein [Gemmatimonadaceae bacterium]|jgi:methoxymalonate biosynthesis acyl carrier protein